MRGRLVPIDVRDAEFLGNLGPDENGAGAIHELGVAGQGIDDATGELGALGSLNEVLICL